MSLPRHAVLCLVVACGAPPAPAPTAPNPAQEPRATGTPHADAANVQRTEADAAPAKAADALDLLHAVPATIVVSSRTGDARDQPLHLVDGRADSAWRSRPGDLVGAWLSVRVPRDAFLHALELTFEASAPAAPTHSPRTLRVRVFDADRVQLALWTLDADRAAPQRLPLERAGGLLHLYVEAVDPPRREDARGQLALTALRLFGTPGATRLPAPSPPQVEVGEAARTRTQGHWLSEEDDPHDLFGRFHAEDEFCTAYATALRAAAQARHDTLPPAPWCTPMALRTSAKHRAAPTPAVSLVELELPGHNSARRLRLHTARGVVTPKGAAVCTQIHEGGCDDDLFSVDSTLISAQFEADRAKIVVENQVLQRESQPPTRRRERLTFECQLAPEPAICAVSHR